MNLRCFFSRSRVANLSKLSSYTSSSCSRSLSTTATSTVPLSYPPQDDHTVCFFHGSKSSKFYRPYGRCIHTLQQVNVNESSNDSPETDEAMNDFLSRFVWNMRKKLYEAYPDSDKTTINAMLLIIVEKVVSEMEKGGVEHLTGAAASAPSQDFSEDLWRTVWEVSNVVLQDMAKEKKKEKMKSFLQSEEVKEMYRFAGEVGIRGDMLRELRFKWAREKMEESEFYQSLDSLCKEESTQEEDRLKIGPGRGEDGVVDDNDVGEDIQKSASLPKRHGKIKYKIYGLDLSDPKWAEVAQKVQESSEALWPQEPKAISGKCKAVTEKILSLQEGDDAAPLLSEWISLLQPSRIDWIAFLDKLKEQSPLLYLKISELVLDEESFETNIRDYSKLIDAYARENRMQDAERILKKMNEKGISPDVITSTIVIHMYCKSGNFDKAKEVFENLRSHGFQPDMKICNSMIMACVNAGKPDLGESLMRDMETRDIMATKEIYMALLSSFSQRGDVKGAQRILSSFHFAGFERSLESYTLLIEAYAHANDNDQARFHFDYMVKCGHKPDDRCVASMIAAYEKKNELDKALDLLLELEKDKFEPGVATYAVLVDWLGKMQLIDEAEHILDKIAKKGEAPPFKLQISLCDMYARAGSDKKALQALGVLESKTEQLGPWEFERIIDALTAGGFEQDARRMWGLMEARGYVASDQLRMSMSGLQASRRNNIGNLSRLGRNK